MSEPRKRYLLENYLLDPGKQELRHDDQSLHLPRKPFQVLVHLIENRDRFVARSELLDLFWDGKDVYDDALRKSVGAIRKALDDQTDQPRFIETRWGVGYHFIGPVEEQIVREEAAVTEIERTRAVRIVFDEEEIHEERTANEATTINVTSAPVPASSVSKPVFKISIAAVVLVAVALGTAALVSYRTRSSAMVDRQPALRSVAVLPLKNLTGDPANDYLSDGVTESVITALSRIEGLKVISRGSAFTFKSKDIDPREAGKLLNVAAIVEGSVRQSGDQVRVDVRLVNAADGQVLWASDSYDRNIRDIFLIQDEITHSVTTGLRIKLSGDGGQRLAKRYTDDVEAYQAYLKGRYFLDRRSADGITKGTEYFLKAIEKDPNYALAYAGLAESYDKAYAYLQLPPKDVMAKEKAAAAKALVLDDSLAEAHVAMATVYANAWDLSNSAREEERAIAIDPGNAVAHHNYSYRLIDLSRPDEAVAEIKTARELDPLNIVMNVDVGEILLFARRYDEAIAALQHALEMDPNRANCHRDLAYAYELKGMYAEATAEYLKSMALSGENEQSIAELKQAFASAGRRGFMQARLKLELSRDYVDPAVVAVIYLDLGEKDRAFVWLEKAYQEHSPHFTGLKVSAWFDSVRSDPRYLDLLRRVGFQA